MALEDITITRALPVINGFVQVPPNIERTNQTTDVATALSTVEGASLENGVLKLPPIKANAWFTSRQLAEITSIETGEPPVYS